MITVRNITKMKIGCDKSNSHCRTLAKVIGVPEKTQPLEH